jgi:glycosyltransferase involved in cell wall biosynthesis
MVRQPGIGGSERQLAEIARKLDRSIFEPHVGCFRPSGIRTADLEDAGVPVVSFDLFSFRSVAAFSAARRITQYVRNHGIRLVHTFDWPTNVFVPPLIKYFTPAFALSSQRAHRDLTPGAGRWALRANDRLVDGIVVNCEFLRKHLAEDERVPRSLIHLCYNGTDTTLFHPGPRQRAPELAGASLVIGVICALRPEKGLETLLEAFSSVCRLQAGVKLLIVGSGPSLSELESQALRLGILPSVVFQPTVSGVAPWYRNIDIFVLPSLSEALSNSLMEAMACGCAVVASNVGGNPELVTDRQTGLLFPSRDAAALADGLRLLIGNERLRSTLAGAAACSIAERFSLAASARRMEQIYLNLLERN